jgi:hypothetical protein
VKYQIIIITENISQKWFWPPTSAKTIIELFLQSTTNPHWARVMGYGSFSLCVFIRKACAPAVGTLIGWWWETLFYTMFWWDEALLRTPTPWSAESKPYPNQHYHWLTTMKSKDFRIFYLLTFLSFPHRWPGICRVSYFILLQYKSHVYSYKEII